MFTDEERAFVAEARVGRMATLDDRGHPRVLPVCFVLLGETIYTPLDEKPKQVDPESLQRVRDIQRRPDVALVVDRYREDWDDLGWVQLLGDAELVRPGEEGHREAVQSLRKKYDQYREQALEERPQLRIHPQRVISWGNLSK